MKSVTGRDDCGFMRQSGFTTDDAFDSSYNGGTDAYLIILDIKNSVYQYGTYLGGSGEDTGESVALDSSNNIYIVGRTFSSNFPTTPDAYDTSQNGHLDGFLVKFSTNLPPSADAGNPYNGYEGSTIPLDNASAFDPDNDPLNVSAVTQGANGAVTNNGGDVTYTPNPDWTGTDTFTYTASDGQGGTATATVTVTVTSGQPTVYVHDIAMSYKEAGLNYSGRAIVWIKDTSGADIEGATVYGEWSGSVTGTDTGTTGPDGTVLLESPKNKNGGTFTFTVTDVVVSGYTYDAGLNNETSDTITAP